MRCQTVVLSISRFCSRFPVGRSEKSGDSSIKIFHQNEQQNKKNKKKDAFFASVEERRQSRFASEKYSFRSEVEKRKIFPEATRRA